MPEHRCNHTRCGRTFDTNKALSVHQTIHKPKPSTHHTCDYCGHDYSYRGIKQHEKACANDDDHPPPPGSDRFIATELDWDLFDD